MEIKRYHFDGAFMKYNKNGEYVRYDDITRPDLAEIERLIERHRAKAFITCPGDCLCWEVEALLAKIGGK